MNSKSILIILFAFKVSWSKIFDRKIGKFLEEDQFLQTSSGINLN